MAPGDVDVAITTNNSKQGAVFDGVDDVLKKDNTLLPYNVGTINFWIKTKDQNAWIFTYWNNAFSEFYDIKIEGGNFKVVGEIGNVEQIALTAGTSLPSELWTHCAIVYDGATTKIYLNGVLDGTDTGASMFLSDQSLATADLWIGDRGNLSGPFEGVLKDFQIHNKPLSITEVKNIVSGALISDGLVHRWKLQEDYTDSVGDKDLTNTETYIANVDDAIATEIKAQRVLMTMSGTALIFEGQDGQVGSVGITETA